jgi:hypothetical protein
MAGMVVGVVRETVRDLIADLVGLLVVCAATAAAKWAARIAQIIKQLVRTLQNLMPLLRRLGDVFEQIRKKMDDLRGKGGGGDKPPDDPNKPPDSPGGGGDHTQPSRDPDPNAQPDGRPTRVRDQDDAETQRGHRRENESATTLARQGLARRDNGRRAGDCPSVGRAADRMGGDPRRLVAGSQACEHRPRRGRAVGDLRDRQQGLVRPHHHRRRLAPSRRPVPCLDGPWGCSERYGGCGAAPERALQPRPRSALLHRQWRTERAGRRGARVLDKRCGRPADLGTYGAVSGAGARSRRGASDLTAARDRAAPQAGGLPPDDTKRESTKFPVTRIAIWSQAAGVVIPG